VVQASESWPNCDVTRAGRGSAAGRLFAKSEMSSVLVVVVEIFREKSFEVPLIQGNDVIEQVTPATPDPALGNTVLPRALDGGLHAFDLHGSNRSWNFQSILSVVIEDEEFGGVLVGECFSQLLHNPGAGGMPSDVAVEDTPAVMTNDEEAVEHAERDARYREEIHCSDGFAVIMKKSEPPLGRFRIFGCSLHPPGNCSLRYVETEHQEFAVDAGSTPSWILHDHPKNQPTNLAGNSHSAARPGDFGEEGPIKAKSRTMPPDHGLRSDDEEGLLPGGAKAAREHPEKSVERTKFRSGVAALQNRELLSERQVLQEEDLTRMKGANEHSKPEPEEAEHRRDL
jgi:hypothetical protein